jgi:hypothetical protein
MSTVTGADRTGRYIVGRGHPLNPNGSLRRAVVMWFNGVRTAIDVPGEDQQLADVNAFGVAVGFSFDANTSAPLTPWIYQDGEVSALPGVASGQAWAVNDRGDVAGTSSTNGARPVRWPAGGGTVRLPLPAGAVSGEARGIDEDGTVVGFYTDADAIDHGVAWRADGARVVLAPPAGLGPETRAFGIRNGWIFGLATGPNGFVPVRWHLPTQTVQPLAQFDIAARGVNWFGWLVGHDPAGRALFVSAHDAPGLRLPRLPRLGNPPAGAIDLATTVNDAAQIIAGQAIDALDAVRAVRWNCQ